jgi:hypothetical protein
MQTFGLSLAATVGLAACVGGVNAQLIGLDTTATLDRWMYPFSGSPGTRLSASTFGAPRLDGFDDHDAQFIVGFDTDGLVPVGLAPALYRVVSATVYATVTNDRQFRFDPTYDNQNTYQSQEGGYPALVPDADTGRPVHLWGVGYRDGFTLETWTETSPFGFNPTIPPAQEARTAFIATFDANGQASDASNHLTAERDLDPMAIGQADGVSPGQLVAADTTFAFSVDLCGQGTRTYLNESLAAGELRFGISCLHPADGGPSGGAGDPSYPVWYTRENPIAQILGLQPRLELEVRVGSAADYNGDGLRNFFDIAAFLDDFNTGAPAADLNTDCTLNFFDLLTFIDEFNTP